MVVIFSESAFLQMSSSHAMRGAVCSQCYAAFKVDDCYSLLENRYPDLQFVRFGLLCINCRAPYVGEGNFEESLDKKGLSAQGANVGLTSETTNLIFDYYTKRAFPEYNLEPDMRSPAKQNLKNLIMCVNKDLM